MGNSLSSIERQLIKISKELPGTSLGQKELRLFFNGVHPVVANEVRWRIRRDFGVDLDLSVFMENPSITELCTLIINARPFKGLLIPKSPLEELPQSVSQQRIWFLSQLEEFRFVNNLLFSNQISGTINSKILNRSLTAIIKKHESLRTTFVFKDDSAFQVINENMDVPLEKINAMGWSEQEMDGEISRIAETSFHLGKGPLFRVVLLCKGNQEGILLIVIHPIICDRLSGNLIMDSLSDHYNQIISGKDLDNETLMVRYADYAIWQHQFLKGDIASRQILFWKEYLKDSPNLIKLPHDHPYNHYPAKESAVRFTIEEGLLNRLRNLAKAEEVSLFTLLLTSWQILLFRYSGQKDIIVGFPDVGRHQAGLKRVVGLFADMHVLRTKFSDKISFREILGSVKEDLINCLNHSDIPFDKILEEVKPERDLSYNPIFQVVFDYRSSEARSWAFQQAMVCPESREIHTSHYDLTLELMEGERQMKAGIHFKTQLFSKRRMLRMTDHLLTMLEDAAANPKSSVKELKILGNAEKQRLLQDWNNTQSEFPQECFHRLFEKRAQESRELIALEFKDRVMTYGELNARANQVAYFLIKRGVIPEKVVGICLDRSFEMIIALLGVMKAGGAYVALDPTYPEHRLNFMIEDCNAQLVLTQSNFQEKFPDPNPSIISMDSDWKKIGMEETSNPDIEVRCDNLAYLIYTSGSTGRPKGVMIEHKGIANIIADHINMCGLRPSKCVLQFASLSFDASLCEIGMTLTSGAKLCLIEKDVLLDKQKLIATINHYKITHATFPPTFLQTLSSEQLPSLEAVIVTGEACPDVLIKAWAQGKKFFNGYGPSEVTIGATMAQFTGEDKKSTIGRPFANYTVYILDELMQPVPIGIIGEIYIGGIGLARGYHKDPQLTAQRFVANPFSPGRLYKTGDMARYQDDGKIEFIGREDSMVKIRGIRIDLGEIESVLDEMDSIEEGIVKLHQREDTNKLLVAFIHMKPGHDFDRFNIAKFLKGKLPAYMIPSIYVELLEVPLTPNGKTDRKVLSTHDIPEMDVLSSTTIPRNSMEKEIAEMFSEILKIPTIGLYDDFFELGGHSLLVFNLVEKLKALFDVEVKISAIFEYPTVAALSEHMEELIVSMGKRTSRS